MATSSPTFSTSLPKFCRPYSISITSPPQVSVYFKKLDSSISSALKISRRRTTRASASSMASSGITTIDQNNKKVVEVLYTEEDLAVSLAKYTADLSDKFAKERGAFTVVVSGGSLIKSLRKLVEAPYVDSIDWSKWHVFWVDERVVPKDHPDSNYKLALDGFLSKTLEIVIPPNEEMLKKSDHESTIALANLIPSEPDKTLGTDLQDVTDLILELTRSDVTVPIPPGNVYAINDALLAEGAAHDYETCLKHLVHTGVINISSLSGFPKFDLMLVGMGPDGHIASLFPGHPLLKENQKWVAHITDSPKPPPERITFTFPVINSSAYIALVVCGAGKASIVQTALGKNRKLRGVSCPNGFT
ncbi:hypothetical protein OIU78_029253 [Salix suchowensis]|nr:hypothetical protein OIU78_029253 [Salix suchowensis]